MPPTPDPSSSASNPSASNPSVPKRPVPPQPPQPPKPPLVREVVREVVPKQSAAAPAATTGSSKPRPSRPRPASPTPKRLPVVEHLPGTAEVLEAGAQNLPGVTADQRPVPPPSEPMQYRAIGLIRGRYIPSEEQFTQGMMVAADGTEIDAVLLGRVMSLIKNHVDLDREHLWVAYPRTRTDDLHVQVVGIWEPETLNRDDADGAPAAEVDYDGDGDASQGSDDTAAQPLQSIGENQFSIRGAVVHQSVDEPSVTVKIRQTPRSAKQKAKAFKVHLSGQLTDRPMGYFWDLVAERRGKELVLVGATAVAPMPPQKRKPFQKGGPRGKGRGPGDRGRGPQRDPRPRLDPQEATQTAHTSPPDA